MKEQTSATTETLSKGRTMIDFTGKTIFRLAEVSSSSIVRLAGTPAFLLKQLLSVQASLYIKGFGAAAVHKLWLQRRTLLKK